MSNLQTYYHFKLDFQTVDQHTGGKRLIHGTKRRKENQSQNLELPCRICCREHDIKESKGNMFNPIFKENVRGGNIQEVVHLQNQNYLCKESLKCRIKSS